MNSDGVTWFSVRLDLVHFQFSYPDDIIIIMVIVNIYVFNLSNWRILNVSL